MENGWRNKNPVSSFVNSIFVARLGEAALSAISLCTPVVTLVAAMGSGIAVGLNAVISKALGEGDLGQVQAAIRTSLFMAVCAYGLMIVSGLFLVRPFYQAQTQDMAIIENGVAYLGTYLIFSAGLMFQWVFDRLVIATGKSSLFLITLSSAALVNIALAPVLIFGYLGLPAMGIQGAALATVIGQLVGAVLGLVLNLTHNRELSMRIGLRPNWAIMKRILYVGVPTALMQGFASVMAFALNAILLGFGATAVALYGIILRIQGVVQIIPNGLGLGVIPIAAYNYGARHCHFLRISRAGHRQIQHVPVAIPAIDHFASRAAAAFSERRAASGLARLSRDRGAGAAGCPAFIRAHKEQHD